jgi:arylsulfatase A-like enzyme
LQVVKSLKETGYYDNTIIVFTTDNGGAVKMGGNNMPLRGTKGTLFEGGTRGIGFVHSPLLQKTGYTNLNMMHAVDWLPTLMSAIGKNNLATSALDGVNQWQAISNPSVAAPRNEIVYNIKERPFMAAIR